MKICTSCKQEKDSAEFYKSSRRKDGLASECKSCSDAYNKATRTANKQKYNKYRTDWHNQLNEQINGWKQSQGCKCCSEQDPCCLELHHLDPSIKEGNPSTLRTSWARFMKEAVKCVVVCANCHRKIHAGKLTF